MVARRPPVPAAVPRERAAHPKPASPPVMTPDEWRRAGSWKVATVGVLLGLGVVAKEVTLCRLAPVPGAPVAMDAPPLPPVPETAWTAGDGGDRGGLFPPPAPGQAMPPCQRRWEEINGACWRKSAEPPPCDGGELLWKDACWTPVNAGSRGPPVGDEP